MTDRSFQITFSGKLLTGFGRAQVMQSLAKVFKIDESKASALLNGRKHILKKNMDLGAAKKYQAALMKYGAAVSIEDARKAAIDAHTARTSTAKSSLPRSTPPKAAKVVNSKVAANRKPMSPPLAAKALPDCPSKPVTLANTDPVATPAQVSPAAKKTSIPLGLVGDTQVGKTQVGKTKSSMAGTAPQPALARQPTQSKSESLTQPVNSLGNEKNKATAPRQSTALEDLQRLLEKSRKTKQEVKPNNLAPGQTQKLPNDLLNRKPSDLHTSTINKQTKPEAIPKRASTPAPPPKSSPLADLTAITQRSVPKPAPTPALTPGKVEPAAAVSVQPSIPSPQPVAKVESQPGKVVTLPKEAKPENGVTQTPFAQPTLLSCAICRQTQHSAPHCLNCGSVFETAQKAPHPEDELAAEYSDEDYESTSLIRYYGRG